LALNAKDGEVGFTANLEHPDTVVPTDRFCGSDRASLDNLYQREPQSEEPAQDGRKRKRHVLHRRNCHVAADDVRL
jgi:hypothetical protein